MISNSARTCCCTQCRGVVLETGASPPRPATARRPPPRLFFPTCERWCRRGPPPPSLPLQWRPTRGRRLSPRPPMRRAGCMCEDVVAYRRRRSRGIASPTADGPRCRDSRWRPPSTSPPARLVTTARCRGARGGLCDGCTSRHVRRRLRRVAQNHRRGPPRLPFDRRHAISDPVARRV
ncbi:hypothetical protein BU14_0023s0016 [Porphyra umbilicalis]|uniref:Uncharacterized protein n=1 Tax=Porphyra umbilicalis TaxID=2786 RepID=A0A1X6PK39_PORUM|nr:hypothetical protein BU14_0023s0016 [Porphyra umbilicalis]|eukprot:OSX81211.1 hypothetical protein BU14_0023s0016 [Porphyra umbilicalis]